MDGWMDGLNIVGGGSRGPRHEAAAAQRPDRQALILFRVPIGSPDPQDLGSCEMEHVTRQLMVGKFRQPARPPQTARENSGQLHPGIQASKHPGPPCVPIGTIRLCGAQGERGGGLLMYTHPVWVSPLLCGTQGYSPRLLP